MDSAFCISSEKVPVLLEVGSAVIGLKPDDIPKDKKKRCRNPDQWKKEKRKRAILAGQPYINTKGHHVEKRTIGPDCLCKHKCFSRISEEARDTIFNGYYALQSYDEQNAYLYGLIRRYDILRKRRPVSERRTCSYKYFVRLKGREMQVCKKAFSNIHGISDKKIRTLCVKHEQNILFPRDNRGRHTNRPKKVTSELINLIKHHILKSLTGSGGNNFMKADKNQGPDVNISRLHKKFLEEFEPEAIDNENDKIIKDYNAKVKSWLYFKVFHDEFNSMDFNTVKRKLSDLRKSLEVSGSLPSSTKRKVQAKPKSVKKIPVSTSDNFPQIALQNHNQISASNIYLGGVQPQQPYFSSNLQLSMLSLQQLNNGQTSSFVPAASHVHQNHNLPSHHLQQYQQQLSHQQQQPLNLQTHGSMDPGGNQPNIGNLIPQSAENSFPFQLHTMSGHPMSSYYLCLGHVSNLIPVQGSPAPATTGGNSQNVFSATNVHDQQDQSQGSNMGYTNQNVGHMY